MAKNSVEAYKAEGKTNLLLFAPENLTLVTDKAHPLYDERVNLPVDENMVLNIMYQGVIEPIVVRKNRETGETEVVAGRQRVKNAIEANVRLRAKGCEPIRVPATIRNGNDGEMAGVMVSENEIRRADTPMGRAEKMAQLLKFGKDESALAVIFGCSEATVKTHLALLECCAAVRNAVEAGKINLGHAKALAKMEPAEQREKLGELVKAGDGAQGHEKARKQREVIASDKPKMRTRKEILAAIADETEDFDSWRDALRWALGEETK